MQWLTRTLVSPFRRDRGASIFVVIGLGTAIGVGVAVLAVAGELRLGSIRVEDADRLVAFFETSGSPRKPQSRFSAPFFAQLLEDFQSSSHLAASYSRSLTLQSEGASYAIAVEFVSDDYFSALGLSAREGRLSGSQKSSKATTDSLAVAVASRKFVETHFKGLLVGSKILLNGFPVVIVGLLSSDFHGLGGQTELWLPLGAQPLLLPENGDLTKSIGSRWLTVFGRLHEASEVGRAAEEAWMLSSRYSEAGLIETGTMLGCAHDGFPWTSAQARMTLLVTVSAFGGLFALLAVSGNVALVAMSQSFARRKEVALRMALGASSRSILSNRVAEMATLAVLGGLFGIATGKLLLALLPQLVPFMGNELTGLSFDVRHVLVALVLAWLTVFVSCLPLLVQVSRAGLGSALAGNAPSLASGSPAAYRVRRLLVAFQIVFCMALISAGMLLYRSIGNMAQVRVAGEPERVLMTQISPSRDLESAGTGIASYLKILESTETLAPVAASSLVSHVPVGGSASSTTVRRVGSEGEGLIADTLIVGPRYFATMGIEVLAGRDFTQQDRSDRRLVAAVNQAFARKYWPEHEALEHRIQIGAAGTATIIGVVEDVKQQSLVEHDVPQVYVPFLQHYQSSMVIITRTTQEANAVAPMIRSAVLSAAPGVRFIESFSMQDQIDRVLREPRIITTVFLFFGCVILVLCLGGLYSILSSFVTLRRREIGVRLALGATRRDSARKVFREALILTSVSSSLGLLAVFGLAQLVSHVLFGLSPIDPITTGIAFLLTLTATVVAAAYPLAEAMTIQPADLLREV